mgnify:FL=1
MALRVYILGDAAAYQNYTLAVERAGGIPCFGSRPADCDCLLLPGGGDIRGPLPGTESFLIDSFARSRRPILGICRGLQALNVHWGGTLRDIPGHQLPRGDLVHPTRAEGLMARLLGEAPAVTSCHHQAVDRLAPPLQAVQWSPDGVVEAAVHRQLPVLGVQWHPERQSYGLRRADAPGAEALFAYFAALIGGEPWTDPCGS